MNEFFLIAIGWVFYYILWFFLARKVNLTKLTNPLPFREGMVWFTVWILVFVTWFFSPIAWESSWIFIIGFFISLAFAISARFDLGENWKPFAAKEADYRLITKGTFKYFRHPIYFFQFLMTLFTAMAFQRLLPALIIVLLPAIANRLRAQKEKELLLKKYPREYGEYRKKTILGRFGF